VVTWDPFTDRLEAWLSTQSPNLARDLLGDVLGLPVDRIRVRTPDVGGGFGNKFDFYGEEVLAALLSKRTGRPVKLIEDRTESFVANEVERQGRLLPRLLAIDHSEHAPFDHLHCGALGMQTVCLRLNAGKAGGGRSPDAFRRPIC